MNYINHYINQIICGNALEVLKEMPGESVNCCVCSPPYWNLRDYGVEGQLGLEKTFEEYITKLCDIFDEVERVLRKDGTCWVNLGDSYGGSGNASGHKEDTKNLGYKTLEMGATQGNQKTTRKYAKCLLDIPYRFSIEMTNRGWIKRNTIIWWKPNFMPSSAGDRFTVDFEYLFFFVKTNKTLFWTNGRTLESVDKKPLSIKGIEGKDWEWRNNKKISLWTSHDYWFEQQFDKGLGRSCGNKSVKGENIKGFEIRKGIPKVKDKKWFSRNKRCVWEISTRSFPEAHFAVYPEGLIEIPIKAGCPEFICKKCGKARVKILETEQEINEWNEKYFYKLLLGNSHSNRHYKTALEIMKKWMIENNCYNYETFYNWYLIQKKGTWKSGNFEMGQANKLSGMLPFPRPEKRLNTKIKGYTDCGCNAGFEGGIV
ncbi:hypothetical protein ES708_10629 [subsurface metagenome]